mgnify:CR=1 FL=1
MASYIILKQVVSDCNFESLLMLIAGNGILVISWILNGKII